MRSTSFLVLLLVLSLTALAAPPDNPPAAEPSGEAVTPDYTRYINANDILMFVSNLGGYGRDQNNVFNQTGPGTFYPYTGIENIQNGTNDDAVLFAAGLWAGGKDNSTTDTLVVVSEYSSEYVPGPMLNGTYQTDQTGFRVYKLYSDSLESNPNADYLNWPVADGAPVDEFGNPAMLGDQMLWSVCNDANWDAHSSNNGQTFPLGIEIQQTVWAYDSDSGPLSGTIFIKYKIYNKGQKPLVNFFLSLWFDPDVGGMTDDMVGCDTLDNIMFAYNADNDDEDYGSTPPAFGCKVIYGPLGDDPGAVGYFDGSLIADKSNMSLYSFNRYVNGTDPDSYAEAYAYMQGLRAKEPGFPPYVYDGREMTFMCSGDPVAGTGDLDYDPYDKRMMGSFGPLTFAPGDSQFVEVAVGAARGVDRLTSITALREMLNQFQPGTHEPIGIRVPDDYETIQEAIDAAYPGDTVMVSSGTYTGEGNRDLDFHGKRIVVRSLDGPEVTIIDCEGTAAEPHRGVNFHSEESPEAVLDGFTITNGYAEDGGGIRIYDSRPTLSNLIVENCTAEQSGGGVYCDMVGGLDATDCVIRHNTAGERGGGLAAEVCYPSSLVNCELVGNSSGAGGAIYVRSTSQLALNQCLLADNDVGSGDGGAALVSDWATLKLNGCTLVGNRGEDHASGVWVINDSRIECQNSLFAYHTGAETINVEFLTYPGFESEGTLACCDFFGNEGGDWTGPVETTDIILDDPRFCDLENGDYSISVLSPCAPGNNPCQTLIGAFEPNCGTFVCGDTDLNGHLNEYDIEHLLMLYFGPRPQWYPVSVADMNCDGLLNMVDIVMLAGYYYGYGSDPCCVAPPKRQDLPGRGSEK